MRLFSRLNQLGRHAHAITAAAHAAFEQITNSEFLTNLGNVFFCTFVSHDGGSGDYPKLGGLELAQTPGTPLDLKPWLRHLRAPKQRNGSLAWGWSRCICAHRGCRPTPAAG